MVIFTCEISNIFSLENSAEEKKNTVGVSNNCLINARPKYLYIWNFVKSIVTGQKDIFKRDQTTPSISDTIAREKVKLEGKYGGLERKQLTIFRM